jgi:NAD+ synthase
MTDHLSIVLSQLNPTVGDIEGNIEKLRAARRTNAAKDADLLVSSELFVSGYPPEDLVLRAAFMDQCEQAVRDLASETADGGPALIVGAPWRDNENLYNAALLLAGGAVAAVRFKHNLPDYGVFDESRVFTAAPVQAPIIWHGVSLGVMICEDAWTDGPTRSLNEQGAEILIVLNGSPFESDKHGERHDIAVERIRDSGLPLVYVNQVGGQDELVFDGASFVRNGDGELAIQLVAWADAALKTEWSKDAGHWICANGNIATEPSELESTYLAMMMGLRDYVGKNGFPGIVLGMSGGIDSALTAAVAADALGPDRVHCIIMPSEITSRTSNDDAAECADLMGVRHDVVSIKDAVNTYGALLSDMFSGHAEDTTEENIQARSRAIILMAISNKFGSMLLTTGNKSEMSVGYATLYGDLSGGYSVLKDVYKTTVYELSKWRNQNRPAGGLGPEGRVIPENIITKAPTAELKPNQTDQDTLPPYDELDDILKGLIEDERSFTDIAATGHDIETVRRIARMLYIAEYKRRQAPPGVKLTRRSFGRERRYPITNAFRETS